VLRGDSGVDVVAIDSDKGELIQCKTSARDDIGLGWDAVKDVTAGEAIYKGRHPGISFRKICIANQTFNENAHYHAKHNDVTLYEQNDIIQLLEVFPVTLSDVERILYADWSHTST
jgi:hypothetical protein